jgi:hypothetical protein
MFEQEMELEKRSSWGPLLLVFVLIGAIVGSACYYVVQLRKGLSQEEASALISAQLKERVATVSFRVGKVTSNVSEAPRDPHYRLLEKAGYLRITNIGWADINSTLTAAGEKQFESMPGVKKWKNPDNTTSYEVPLATRKLVKIDSVTLNGPSNAKVEYQWKWEPNSLGEIFDASGASVKSFNTWDRSKLIDKYGANFYHADPKKEAVLMNKGDTGWKINTGY